MRGFSGVSLLIIDEAARVPDDLYYAVRPMLTVSQGRLILLSTPHGRQGFFFEAWTKEKGWLKIKISAQPMSPPYTTSYRRGEGLHARIGFFDRNIITRSRPANDHSLAQIRSGELSKVAGHLILIFMDETEDDL